MFLCTNYACKYGANLHRNRVKSNIFGPIRGPSWFRSGREGAEDLWVGGGGERN